MEKAAPTRKTKKRARIDHLRTTGPSLQQRRVMGRQINKLESGVNSIKVLGITSVNVTQSSCWWPR
jgi:hypothetical protein